MKFSFVETPHSLELLTRWKLFAGKQQAAVKTCCRCLVLIALVSNTIYSLKWMKIYFDHCDREVTSAYNQQIYFFNVIILAIGNPLICCFRKNGKENRHALDFK